MTFIDPTTQLPFSIEEDATATPNGRLTIDGYVHSDKGSFCGPEVPPNASGQWTRAAHSVHLKRHRPLCRERLDPHPHLASHGMTTKPNANR